MTVEPALFDAGPVVPVAIESTPDWTRSVELRHARDHSYQGERGRGKRCTLCGRGKSNMTHVGYPQSLNVSGSAGVAMAYQSAKKHWQAIWTEQLEASGLPKGLLRVDAEGTICFPDRTKRDQGNFRFMLEKSLGDALVEGGWLEDDSWDFYEFGHLRRAYDKGQAWTAITVAPTFA